MLLAHPEAEDLGRFVEGTLDDPERNAIVQHIADCDDCRVLVVDAAEFESQSVAEPRKWGIARWIGVAAAAVFVAMLGTFSHYEYRENAAGKKIDLVQDVPRFMKDALHTSAGYWGSLLKQLGFSYSFPNRLSDLKEAYGKVPNRPLEARISGFPYVPRVINRGTEDESDIQLDIMKGKAADLIELSGTDADILHAHGIGVLLGDDPKNSTAPLQAAAAAEPNNATYQNDLAVALIAAARGNPQMLESALAACDRALRIDPNSPDALFNRAVALQGLERAEEAIAAYDRYLAVDPSSQWAAEARKNRDLLRSLS